MDSCFELSPDRRYLRYNISLGEGSLKEVFKTFDTINGKMVAWNKICKLEIPLIYEKNIINEINILKEIQGKNNYIINTYSAWFNNELDEYNFITELVSGGNLHDYINNNKLIKINLIKKWSYQILQGINFLHKNEIIHRDIKPNNIFLDLHTGDIKIGDFGFAIKFNEIDNKLIGTPQFMALEIIEGSYNYKVDIYAFGMTLLQLSTNKIPYTECKTKEGIWKKLINGEKPFLLDDQQIPSYIYDLINKSIDNVDSRYEINTILQHEFFSINDDTILNYSNVLCYENSNKHSPV